MFILTRNQDKILKCEPLGSETWNVTHSRIPTGKCTKFWNFSLSAKPNDFFAAGT